ncbi:hypothetical protein [Rhodoferax sp. U11-2br]|uniref:hypothetical protein n=1 Tax=Rhodoferax sp. U11-2br TaxID=2838878 RepID=UPI0020368967|nr:hypothetical protein [Rhodoferax sp. U11-2br]
MFVRSLAVVRARQTLQAKSYPRLQMTLITGLTGAFGLVSSYVLLHLGGVESMTLRYPLALVCAYGMFLFLIWLWLRTQAQDYLDLPNLSGSSSNSGSGCSSEPLHSGGGGDFGGGGASASFDGPGVAPVEPMEVDFDVSESVSSVADADELALPLMAVVLALGLALASLYVIYIAPALLAEVLVDGAFSYALYRYVRGDDPAHWLATAVRRTVLPFLATGVFLMVLGAALSAYAPGAHSMGDLLIPSRGCGGQERCL